MTTREDTARVAVVEETSSPVPVTIDGLLNKAAEYLPADSVDLIRRAYELGARAHDGQCRKSGEPYIIHPLAAAWQLCELRLDSRAIAAAILHDVPEDTGVSLDAIRDEFGDEVAQLVDGVTKLSKISYQARSQGAPRDTVDEGERHAENLRKMLLAMADDIRVVLIKLADRLHNMRTLDALPPEKQRRIAQETMEIFAPLAHRLGIWQFKWELEDLSFKYLDPEKYAFISRLVASHQTERETFVGEVIEILRTELERAGIRAEVKGRAKHIYSIHQKMEKYAAQGKDFSQIYDLVAVRILVDEVQDCYSALGVVHTLWPPIPGQFDDYIAMPKESMYQSLHTTVLTQTGRPIEIQIRTQEMHRVSEYGVAAHWRYKEGSRRDIKFEEKIAWLRQLLEWRQELSGAREFVETVKTDVFRDRVFVYTPKGEIKD
ncbi:MAG TPA: RelA/SpoT family protein, partial [Dehalococcoidia bacterium]|nr:RelA/SpoT family protein [Dehalococcoidia bacterium]